ncbi:hypothetical protein ERO13_A10G189901v2 [Gossypium hirsutum]|nr:hypothetical protein ERO13_A10G189901v2 [Gossypium hirsutum]
MAFKIKASTALFFSFNLLFFTSVNSYNIDDYSKDSKNPVFIRPGDVYSNNQDQLASFRFWEVGCWRMLISKTHLQHHVAACLHEWAILKLQFGFALL